jgi:beta-glucosidase
MWRRWRALTAGGVAVLCSLAIGASAAASSGSDRGATASHPNAALRAMTPAQRAKVSPHLAYARPGVAIHERANAGTTGDVASCPWLNTSLPINQRVSMLLGQMTLADKLDLMEGHNGDAPNGAIGDTHAIPALCVPEVTQQDGPAGVADGVSGATQLPAPVNDAATWDTSAAKQYGQVLGNEQWTKGNMVVYGPTINIDRDPRWGRNFESLSEDPLLTGTLGAAEIEGIQSQGPIAQVKHYAIYNNETNRNTSADDVVIDPRTMNEIYLPAFYDTAIKGGAGSVMCSYSSPNGTFACQNQPLLSILEQRWGYKGWVGSDYGAVHGAIASVNAGLDQEQGSQLFGPVLEPAVQDGQVPMSTIDAAATRILFEMFTHGFFNTQPTGDESTNASTPAHVAFAQQNSEEGTVLLKNSGSILPLSSSQTSSIAVIGADGTTDPETAGGGSAAVNPTGSVVSPLQGITARAGSGVTVSSYSGTTPADAAATARGAKVAIVFANNFESEGSDLQNITLQNNQDALISAVTDANPHTIVVLNTGGPVTMPWLSNVQGVLEAWYPGQQDGAAIASILFGDTNPSGHLPETFPVSLAQAPTAAAARFPGVNGTVQYSDKLEVGYRYYDTENVTPLFPFGFGLSYTSFKYSKLKLSANHVTNTTSGPDGGQGSTELTVTATVKNTGSRAGADVAQLYLGDPAAVGEPARQLEGFQRVMLAPGQSKTVTFPLSGHALSYFDTTANGWVLPTGDFTAYVGDSSALENLPLSKSFTVTKSVGARTEALSVPASVGPESTFTATATFNNDGDFPLTGVSSNLSLPTGWSAKAQSAIPAKVLAHQSVTESWTVTVPASAQGTTGTLTASISGSTQGGAATKVADDTEQVKVDPAIEATASPAQLIDPGQSTTLSVSLTNRLPDAVTVNLAPQPPTGITVTPSPDTLTIPGDGTATATFTVSATAAGSGNQTIPLAITVTDGSMTFTVAPTPTSALSINVAFGSLAAAFDNTGISDESAPFTSASFDTGNDSFSEQQLTTAGFGPGATFTHDGIPYTWPSAAAGNPDNVIGDGQVIEMSGQGSMLGVLGASNNGNATGPVTVIYTDGTQTTGQVTLNDWYSDAEPAPGDILVTTPNWDHSPSQGTHAVSIYAESIPIDPTKTVADVILPSPTTQLSTASGPFHVFALGIGTPPAALSAQSKQAKRR